MNPPHRQHKDQNIHLLVRRKVLDTLLIEEMMILKN